LAGYLTFALAKTEGSAVMPTLAGMTTKIVLLVVVGGTGGVVRIGNVGGVASTADDWCRPRCTRYPGQ
jgi:hypothetical protein